MAQFESLENHAETIENEVNLAVDQSEETVESTEEVDGDDEADEVEPAEEEEEATEEEAQ